MDLLKGTVAPDLHLGSASVSGMYLGTNQIWSSLSEPPQITSSAAVWWASDLTVGNGNSVSSWVDRKNGKTISNSGVGQPLLDSNGIAGKPAVTFNGTNNYLIHTDNNAISTSQTGTIIAVVSIVGPANDRCIWSTADESSESKYIQASHWNSQINLGYYATGLDGAHGDRVLDTTPVILEWTSNGASWSFRVNNIAQQISIDIGGNNGSWFADVTDRDNFVIGALKRSSVSKYLNGKIAYLGVFDTELTQQERSDIYTWASGYYGITTSPFSDSFTRANSNSTLGDPWVTYNAGVFGITSNAAYKVAPTGAFTPMAIVDAGSSNLAIEWDLSFWPKGPTQATFRFVDIDNYWFVAGTNSTAGTIYLFKNIAGVQTIVATQTGVSWGVGYRLRVETTGSQIVVKVNGSTLNSLTTANSQLATATKAGIGGYATGTGTAPYLSAARWTRFNIEKL